MDTNFPGKAVAPLLLVQNITLVWYKDSRGAPGGGVRARFPLAHPITKAASPLPPGEAVVHSLRFYQWSPEEIITNRANSMYLHCRRPEQYGLLSEHI